MLMLLLCVKVEQLFTVPIHPQQSIIVLLLQNTAKLVPESLCFCYGGAIYISGDKNNRPTITNCIVSKNSVGSWGLGGGIYCGGSNLTIRNCLISKNTSGYEGDGGGICCEHPESLTIINCTIADNKTEGNGGGIYFYLYPMAPHILIINSIIWGNLPDQIYTVGTKRPTLAHSDIQGGWPLPTGSLNLEPLFADPANGDYHLKSQAGRWDPNSRTWVTDANTSPCIDRGSSYSDWTAELWPHGKRINMGAYGGTPEASMSLSNVGNIADLNNDDAVSLQDYAEFANKWRTSEILLAEDLNRDGIVDFSDLFILVENWLWEQ